MDKSLGKVAISWVILGWTVGIAPAIMKVQDSAFIGGTFKSQGLGVGLGPALCLCIKSFDGLHTLIYSLRIKTESFCQYWSHRPEIKTITFAYKILARNYGMDNRYDDQVREQLAEYAHQAWSGWMIYLFRKGTFNEDGTWTMPDWAVERWQRQAATDYKQLTDEEKENDRSEADKILALVAPTQHT